jgi:hypothetical protein
MKTNLFLALFLSTFCLTAQYNTGNAENKFQESKATLIPKDIVQIYPNPSQSGVINVSSNITEKIHFYIFDLEGTMIHQAVFRNKQKQTISNLKKRCLYV